MTEQLLSFSSEGFKDWTESCVEDALLTAYKSTTPEAKAVPSRTEDESLDTLHVCSLLTILGICCHSHSTFSYHFISRIPEVSIVCISSMLRLRPQTHDM